MGMSGAKVFDTFQAGDLKAIRDYCETDVLNTWLVFLRFQMLRGELDATGYQAELEGLPELDRAGVFLRLGALRDQVDRLVALPVPEFDPTDVSAEEEYADRLQRRDRWDRVLMRLER